MPETTHNGLTLIKVLIPNANPPIVIKIITTLIIHLYIVGNESRLEFGVVVVELLLPDSTVIFK